MDELEAKISQQALVNPLVSKVSVGWHIEHALLTVNAIIEALKNSNPASYKWTFSFSRILVFIMNDFPRGRAQAPTVVRPTINFNQKTLVNHINLAKEKIKELDRLQPNNYFEHPYFGHLNVKPAIKFIRIHTKHHLDIINDILKRKE